MKKFLTGVIAVAVVAVFMVPAANAGFLFGTAPGPINVGGDLGGSNIADTFGDVVAEYTNDQGSGTSYSIPSVDTSSNVLAVYGDTITQGVPTQVSAIAGDTFVFNIDVTNWGNVSDSIQIGIDTSADVTGTAKDSVVISISGTSIFDTGSVQQKYYTGLLAPGANQLVTVIYDFNPTIIGDAVAILRAKAKGGMGGEPNGYTVGSDNYAGVGDDNTTLDASIEVVDVKISTKVDTVNAPVGSGYNGDTHDIVPGSILTVHVDYDNDGNDSAANLIISAYIPDNTVLDTAPASLCNIHSGGSIADTQITFFSDTGGVVPYGSPDLRRIEYKINGGLVSPNNGDNSAIVDGPIPDVDAGRVVYKVKVL